VIRCDKCLAYTALPGVKDLEEKFEKRQQKRMRVIKQFFEYQKSISGPTKYCSPYLILNRKNKTAVKTKNPRLKSKPAGIEELWKKLDSDREHELKEVTKRTMSKEVAHAKKMQEQGNVIINNFVEMEKREKFERMSKQYYKRLEK
jgi:hypothetical protein